MADSDYLADGEAEREADGVAEGDADCDAEGEAEAEADCEAGGSHRWACWQGQLLPLLLPIAAGGVGMIDPHPSTKAPLQGWTRRPQKGTENEAMHVRPQHLKYDK